MNNEPLPQRFTLYITYPEPREATFCPQEHKIQFTSASGYQRIVPLGFAENRILYLMLTNAGEPLSREKLTHYAWNERVVAAGSLTQAIFNLRNALDDGDKHDIIQTIPRKGYRINPEYFQESPLVNPSTSENSTNPTTQETSKKKSSLQAKKFSNIYFPSFILAGFCVIGILTFREAITELYDPLHESTVNGKKLTIHILRLDNSHADSINNYITKKIHEYPLEFEGEVWITTKQDSYRISCISTNGAALSQETAISTPLANLISQCQANLGKD